MPPIAEALGVAIALNAGATMAYSARLPDAYASIDGILPWRETPDL